MKSGFILKSSFIFSLVITIIGGYLKIMHENGSEPFLIIGLIASLIFIVTAIYEIRTSKRIDSMQKNIWTIAFIGLSSVAGLAYLLFARKRIATK